MFPPLYFAPLYFPQLYFPAPSGAAAPVVNHIPVIMLHYMRLREDNE